MNDNKTLQIKRMPQRPSNGLLAWQATIGYITHEYGVEAVLTLRVQPEGAGVRWWASAAWPGIDESVEGEGLPVVLRDLWPLLDHAHPVYKTKEDLVRMPAQYPDDQWVDGDTQRALDSLIDVTSAVFQGTWALYFTYQAVDNPAQRVKAHLLAKADTIQISGQGPTLREACRDLYRQAAPDYFASSGRSVDSLL